jgi:hypothetical protein
MRLHTFLGDAGFITLGIIAVWNSRRPERKKSAKIAAWAVLIAGCLILIGDAVYPYIKRSSEQKRQEQLHQKTNPGDPFGPKDN